MNLQELAKNLDNMTVGLDDTFKFHCDQCGMCCINREDILLNPRDIYRMAKALGKTPGEFCFSYCESYIGENSRVPIVRLRPRGQHKVCPLLDGNKCKVHKAKPAVCAMFPLGRYMAVGKDDYNAEGVAKAEVKYLLQPIECGDESETHTVRDWLSSFNIELEDQAFIRWQQTISSVSNLLKELEKKWDPITLLGIWFVVRQWLYEMYETDKDFLPQFEHNVEHMMGLLQDIPKLKEMIKDAIRP